MTHRTTIVLAGLLAALSFRPVHAQTFAIDRGVWQLSGSAGLSSSSSGGSSSTSISLSPKVGYFLHRGLELSIRAPVSYRFMSGGHQSGYGVAPGVAFYFGGPKQHVYPYISANGSLSWNQTDYWYQSTSPFGQQRVHIASTGRQLWLTGAIGLATMIARNFALTSEAYYSRTWLNSTNGASNSTTSSSTSAFGLSFGIAAFVF